MEMERAIAVCERMTEGVSLRQACEDTGLSKGAFLRWVNEDKALEDHYTRAREAGAEIHFDGLHETADAQPERDDKGRIDPAWVAHQKLKIDTRKWTLARMNSKKYGEKLTQEHANSEGKPFELITRRIVSPT